ncbi:MAG: ComF family protein [Gammaproteobacteria bacterium]|nr:ComF family protein [Gammaproteobacteria bacterium]
MIKKIFNQLFPHTCVFCKKRTGRPLDLCRACEQKLSSLNHACPYCALPIPDDIEICARCLKQKPPFDRVFIPYVYEGSAISLIRGLKFSSRLPYADILGNLLVNFFDHLSDENKPDCIIPVPLHAKRLKERGFNQALEIAKPISQKLKIPIDTKSCTRIKYTLAQASLPKKDRKKNVQKAFGVTPQFQRKHVMLIDDVMTTGNTLNELSQILKQAGVKKVDICCCARTILTPI